VWARRAEQKGGAQAVLAALVADSHDNLPMIERAVEVCGQRGAEVLLHAGDFVSPFAAKAWVKFDGAIMAVFGNNDGERAGLRNVIPDVQQGPHLFEVGGRKVLVSHREEDITEPLLEQAELVVVAHTHRSDVGRRGNAILVNPGEVGAWLTGRGTVALVDLNSLEVEVVEL